MSAALVSFRGGALVGRAPLSQFGPPGDILEEEVRGGGGAQGFAHVI